MINLTGRTVVVTGASRGIGEATARAMARAGSAVVLLARSPEVMWVAQGIRKSGGQASAYQVDLTDAAAVEAVAQRILADVGVPDVVVNNAGAGRMLSLVETPPDEAVAMMASPYFAAFFVTRAFLPGMLAKRDGCVVNVTSAAAGLVWPGAVGYTAARAAMRGFSDALEADVRGSGVRVMLVMAGKVASTYFAHNPGSEARIPAVSRLMPTLTPDEVGRAIVDGVRRERSLVVLPFMLRVILAANTVAPGLVKWLVWRTGWRRK